MAEENERMTITEVTVEWPDDKFIEEGIVIDEDETNILFQSHYDKSINWVPKEFVK